jgi:hypothetical protein
MAKCALVALVLATLMVAGMASEFGRNLQQVTAIPFNCDGARQLATTDPKTLGGKKPCEMLCNCAGALNAAYKKADMQKFCMTTCEKCSAAGLTCPKGSALPKDCAAGANIKEVGSCISTFLKTRAGH